MSIHHMTNTRLFNVWQNIKRRCYTKTNPSYKYYGDCGIKMCKEWRENFISFYTWAMANGYDENAPKGVCTLDRININGDYEPNRKRAVGGQAMYIIIYLSLVILGYTIWYFKGAQR